MYYEILFIECNATIEISLTYYDFYNVQHHRSLETTTADENSNIYMNQLCNKDWIWHIFIKHHHPPAWWSSVYAQGHFLKSSILDAIDLFLSF